MITLHRAIPCLLAAFLLTGAGEPPASPDANAVVAQRGDLRLTRAQLADALSLLEPAARAQVTASPQAIANFARERLLNQVVLAEAKANNWDSTPEMAKRISEARDALIVQTYLASKVTADSAFPSEAEVAAAYESNRARLMAPRMFHLAQIVLTVPRDANAKEDDDIRKKALELRALALKPKADFADIARKNSQEQSSAGKGGDVGWLREPDLLQSAHDAVLALTDGAVSQPVRMPDGWHVLRLLESRPSGQIPLNDARPQIVQALRQARTQQQIRTYLDAMLKAQPLDVNEIELGKAANAAK